MSSTTGKRLPLDYYPTPAWAVRAIMPHLPTAGSILDPCAGAGALIRAIGVDPMVVDAIEIDEKWEPELRALGCDVHIGDAFAPEAQSVWTLPHGLVIANPPFSRAIEFAQHSISHQARHNGTTVLLMRLGMMAGKKRREFWQRNPADVYVLSRRPSFVGNGTDSCDYGWFVWGPGRGHRWFALEDECSQSQVEPQLSTQPARWGTADPDSLRLAPTRTRRGTPGTQSTLANATQKPALCAGFTGKTTTQDRFACIGVSSLRASLGG